MKRINGVNHQLQQAVSEVGATVQDGNTSGWPAERNIKNIYISPSSIFEMKCRKYWTAGDSFWSFFLIFLCCGLDKVLIRSNKRERKVVIFQIKMSSKG